MTWSIVLSNYNSINKALSCLTMLSCPRCGSGNLKNRKITQHASYFILHGSKHIVPCAKRHIGKADKVQFVGGWLTLLFSSAARTLHTTANETSCKCDSGKKMWKTFFGTSSLFPYMVLFTSINIQKKFLKNSQKRCKNPQTSSTILFGLHCTHHCWWYQC